MSQTHEDRVAQRSAESRNLHMCAAYGCPLTGTSTSSTTGSPDWWCFAHFGADIGRYQVITSEMNRVRWLAMAVYEVRYHDRRGTEESRKAMELIHRELEQHGRKDLQWNGSELRKAWLERLEAALKDELSAVMQPPVEQLPLGVGQPAHTFSKVGFDMPA